MTKQTKAKVPIKNPFGAKTAVLSGAKRSITDLYKPNRNPIQPMNKSTVLALQDQSYKAGLLAGKRKFGHSKTRKNPIGLDDALDLIKSGALGAGMAFGVDLLAGTLFPKLKIYKKDTNVTDQVTKVVTKETGNENVYWIAKLAGVVVAAELLNEPTKGMSYTGAAGAVATYLHGWATDKFNNREGAAGSSLVLGSTLPAMRLVPPPNITMAGAGLAGYGDGKNVMLQPTPAQQTVKNPCGCGGQSGMNLAGVGRGVGTGESVVMNGVVKSADTTPRLFGGVKRRR